MKQKAIVCDLDGTFCNTDHRQHFISGGKKDWKNFFDAMIVDPPNEWCQILLGRFSRYEIVFVSGRPDNYRPQTESWLRAHGYTTKDSPLYMRKEHDFRPDHIVKTEIYKRDIEPLYDIIFCVDDRQQVVDAWRALGLTCLQCAKGDF